MRIAEFLREDLVFPDLAATDKAGVLGELSAGLARAFPGLTVETHLLDYSGNFSPKRIEVRFWKKLREEKKFGGPEELKAQIAKDIARANEFFARLRKVRAKRLAGMRD